MPFEGLWDPLEEEFWDQLALRWLQELRQNIPLSEREIAPRVGVIGFTAKPEQQWQFLSAAVDYSRSNAERFQIARGPFAVFARRFGEEYFTFIETAATNDPKFARMLGCMTQGDLADSLWNRLQAVAESADDSE